MKYKLETTLPKICCRHCVSVVDPIEKCRKKKICYINRVLITFPFYLLKPNIFIIRLK